MPASTVLQIKERAIKKPFIIFWFWAPVVLWMLVIFHFSSIPGGIPTIDIPNIDKFFHAVEYFILGVLLARAFSNSASKPNYRYILIASILIAALYGASDEIHQRFVAGRSCDMMDLLFDMIGAFLGAAITIYKERNSCAVDKAV